MYNTKCGCPYCKGESIPVSRNGWKKRKNKFGKTYGSFRNSTAKHHGRRPQ